MTRVAFGRAGAWCVCALAAGAAAAAPNRPYELDWAGRTTDDAIAPLEAMAEASAWRIENASNCTARLETDVDEAVFGASSIRLVYRATGAEPSFDLVPTAPLPVPAGADTLSVWIYGNTIGRDPSTPGVTLTAHFTGASAGAARTVPFEPIDHKYWFKHLYTFPAAGADTRLTRFTVTGGTNSEERLLRLNSLCVFRDPCEPVDESPLPDVAFAATGILPPGDSAEGRREGETTLVSADGRLRVRLPADATRWDAMTFSWCGGPEIPFACGGGLVTRGDAGAGTVDWKIVGRSLVAEIDWPGGGVTEVRPGGVTNAVSTQSFTFPYYSYQRPGVKNRPRVLRVAAGGAGAVLLAATPDWTVSRAAALFIGAEQENGAVLPHGGAVYNSASGQARRDVRERLVWSFGETLDEVLPSIPNPVSPWRRATAERCWGVQRFPDYNRESNRWTRVHARGARAMTVAAYGYIFGDEMGSSCTLRTAANPAFGGDAALADYARYLIGALGFRYGPYNNFTDLSPLNAHWSRDRVVRTAHGQYQRAFRQHYLLKAGAARALCETLTPQIQAKYAFNTGYCDVHTCMPPWFRIDRDARVEGASQYRPFFLNYIAILAAQKRGWNGPVYSEGGAHWLYAGFSDGNYAQDPNWNWNTEPWIVDFDLLRIHPHENNFGMGSYEMFLEHTGGAGTLERFVAATLAFGHTAFLPSQDEERLSSYYLVKGVAARYGQAKASSIAYCDASGAWLATEAALAGGAVARSQVRVGYDDGTYVFVNGSRTEDLEVSTPCGRYILPPDGFVAASGDGQAQTLRVRRDGRIVARAVTVGEYVYLDGGGAWTRFEEGSCDGVMIRVPESPTVETVHLVDVTRLELPYAASRVTACDAAGRIVTVRPTVVQGRTTLESASGLAQLNIVKRRAPEIYNVTVR